LVGGHVGHGGGVGEAGEWDAAGKRHDGEWVVVWCGWMDLVTSAASLCSSKVVVGILDEKFLSSLGKMQLVEEGRESSKVIDVSM